MLAPSGRVCDNLRDKSLINFRKWSIIMAQTDIPQKTKIIMTIAALFMPVFLILPFFFWGGEDDSITIDKELQASRLAPVGQLTVGAPAPAGGAAVADASSSAPAFDAKGEYDKICAACHGSGLMGAPKFGDTAAWQARLDKHGSLDALVKQGIQGLGSMPPKGGAGISDEQFHDVVVYLLENANIPQGGSSAAAPAAGTAAAPQVAVSEEAAKLRGTTEKLPRMRKVIAERMVESLRVASQLTATVEVDLTAISKLRKVAKDDFKKREGASLSYLPFITKATIEALKAMPVLNASADFEAGTVTYASQENIGIAVDTDRGLMVPVIHDAGDLNLAGLAKRIGDLAARTRAGKVGPDELGGGTFTITNYGSAGTLFDTPIINLPQVAILGTGALVKRPVVVTDALGEDTIAIRDMMYLSLTYDHRLIDGAKAARFLSLVKARLEAGDFAGELGL